MINPSKLYFGIEGSCSTRYQSGTEIRYLSLTIDPSRSLKCISPQTVPHTARPFTQSGCTTKLRAKQGGNLYQVYDGLWCDTTGKLTHDPPHRLWKR